MPLMVKNKYKIPDNSESKKGMSFLNSALDNQNTKKICVFLFAMIFLALIWALAFFLINDIFADDILLAPGNLRQVGDAVVWDEVDGADGYKIDLNGEIFEAKSAYFDVSKLFPNTYEIKAKAMHKANEEKDSVYSDTFAFAIEKQKLSVQPNANVLLSKIYNGSTAYDGEIKLNEHYTFCGSLKYGNNVSLKITKMHFNDANVGKAKTVTISFSSQLDGTDAENYQIEAGSIAFDAFITAKTLFISPNNIAKQALDQDNLHDYVFDEELKETIPVTYSRVLGENVGFYDFIEVFSSNRNYNLIIKENTGKEKFEITQRYINIIPMEGRILTKIFDGTIVFNNISEIQKGREYVIENIAEGYETNISILSAEYNSSNVTDASIITVRFNFEFADNTGFYKTIRSSFEISGEITPLPIIVTPDLFEKKYSENIDLSQVIFDDVSGEFLTVTFISTAGTNHDLADAGTYDITAVSGESTNHAFVLNASSCIGKYVISKNSVTLFALNKDLVYTGSPQSIDSPYSIPSKPITLEYKLVATDTFATSPPTNAGTYIVRATFAGDNNYFSTNKEVTLFIDKAVSVISNLTPNDYVYDGTVKPLVATLNHNETALSFSRNDFVDAGTYNYILITAAQTANYKAASIVATLSIAQKTMADDEIIFPTASQITYGQYLHESALTGGSTLGTFAWSKGNIIPTAADLQFAVVFTPYDNDNYDWSRVITLRMVEIVIERASITQIEFPVASAIIHGQTLSSSVLMGTSPYGLFSWQTPNLMPTVSGAEYNVVFTPYDTLNYDFDSVVKTKAIPIMLTYPIHFVTNCAIQMADILVQQLTSAPLIERDGYVFLGWYLDTNFTNSVVYPYNVENESTFYALWRPKGLKFALNSNGDGYIVSANSFEASTHIIIPEKYRGLPVVAIAEESFANNLTITHVSIPRSVLSIGARAFFNAKNLKEIEIDNVQSAINVGVDWSKTNGKTDIHYLLL